MTHVTLLGKLLCKEGEEFIYLGPLSNCKNCKLKTVCFNLKPGREYKVVKIRDKKHSCQVHDQDVFVVEVEELPLIGAVDKKSSKGDKVTISTIECPHIACEYHMLCTHPGIQKNKEYRVVKTLESINCPKKHQLKQAQLSEN